ncbi:hypothetical protein C8Q80DRAFT_791615 [Daedaleopsis nitida]|nr:hypothetical protein C8Q80DRAFT_791615 [Daedaleopsis nitida]
MASLVVAIVDLVISIADLQERRSGVEKQPLPDVPPLVALVGHWLQPTIKNGTQFKITFLTSHFDSGEYHTKPADIAPFEQMTFSCIQNRNFHGVAGGTQFRISFDDAHYMNFAVGWTNPEIGSLKASAVEGGPYYAYEQATDKSTTLTSKDMYEAKDKDGNSLKFRIQITAQPGATPVFVVKQAPA